MTGELTLLAALLAGLFGSVHCLGMCGGIVGALSMGTPAARRSPVHGVLYSLLFNLGRIGSYAVAGLVAGGFGMWLGNVLNFSAWTGLLRILTGLIMVAIGLQLAINWRGLRHIEAVGAGVWRRLTPLTRRLLPVRSPGAALALGSLWGWLPCGLVYTMLLAAAVSGSPIQGGLVMAVFGAGTLPALVGAGAAASQLSHLTRRPALRRAGGALLLAFGAWTIAGPMLMHGHGHSHAALTDDDCTTPTHVAH